MFAWRWRLKIASYHFFINAIVISAIALLIFYIWFPAPLWRTSGGLSLFGILVFCDLVLGPLISFIVSNPKKKRREWVFDLSFVVLIQMAALGYGVWTVWQVRPIYVVFERDLYRVVRLTDIPESLMSDIPERYRSFPILGPKYLSLRGFNSFEEQIETTAAEIEGLPMSAQPKFWIDYESGSIKNGISGKSFKVFKSNFVDFRAQADAIQADSGISANDLIFYPFVDKEVFWTVFVVKGSGRVVGHLPVDPYSN